MAESDQDRKNPSAVPSNRKRRLSDCYNRGMHLATCEKNYDYAHMMFAECVLQEPGDLQYVEAMVQNLRAKMPQRKKSPFAILRGSNRPLKKALQRKDWSKVFRAGVDFLKNDPWDVTTLRALAEACAALQHNEVELVYLKQALDAEPKNVDVNRHCARSLGRMGQFDHAIACWHRIETSTGKDAEATRMISILAEEKLRYPGGRPPTVQVKEPPAAEPEPNVTPREVVLSPQQKLEQAITQDSQNYANYIELAKLLLDSNRMEAAETLLRRAVAACGELRPLIEKLERVRFLRAEKQHALAEEADIEQQLNDNALRIPWFELGLGSAAFALAVQLIPSARAAVSPIFNFRQWSRSGWMIFNVVVLFGLVALRFFPDVYAYVRRRRIRRKYRTSDSRPRGSW